MAGVGLRRALERLDRTHEDDAERVFQLVRDEREDALALVRGDERGAVEATVADRHCGPLRDLACEVVWNGEAVEGSRWDAYRQQFSAVFSDFHLFEDLSSRGEDVDRRARDVLAMLQLTHKVEIKDGVLSTIDLSQGQRRRLALLSACIEDRPVYVFDEWAADQDPIFKELFYREILPSLRARGKVVFVISHDDRYFDGADRLYKLEDGKLVASR